MVLEGQQNKRRDCYRNISSQNVQMARRIVERKPNVSSIEKLDNQFQKNRNVFNKMRRYKKSDDGKLVMKGNLVFTDGRYRPAGQSYMAMSIKNSPRVGSKKDLRSPELNLKSRISSANSKRSLSPINNSYNKFNQSTLPSREYKSIDNNSYMINSYISKNNNDSYISKNNNNSYISKNNNNYNRKCNTNRIQLLDNNREGYLRSKYDYNQMLMTPSLLSKSLMNAQRTSQDKKSSSRILLKNTANSKPVSIMNGRLLSGYQVHRKIVDPKDVKRLTFNVTGRKLIKKKSTFGKSNANVNFD